MLAGQKLIADDGKEVLLFPMEYMYITQGEHGSLSHVLAMDFAGYGPSGVIYKCPYYSPCTVRCIAKNYENGQAYVIYQSTDVVHKADNTLSIVTFVVMHDDTPPYNVGDIVTQGSLLGHTGTSGFVTGDHLHLNVANGEYAGWESVGGQFYELVNSMSIYNAMFVNDTVLVQDYGYNWKTYTGGVTPPTPPIAKLKKKFPWVLYAKKIRNKRIFY